jgi:hypothetical protein
MRKDEEGNEVPSTLGEYRKLCAAIGGVDDNPAVEWLDAKIAKQGEHEEVLIPDSQMRNILMPMLANISPHEALKPEEVEPGPKELELAKQLLAEGWLSVSTKRRRVARLTDKWLTAEKMIIPEVLDTELGQVMQQLWRWEGRRILRRVASGRRDEQYIEERTLTVKQFRAFKRLGGDCA